jgi:hypothetical protein
MATRLKNTRQHLFMILTMIREKDQPQRAAIYHQLSSEPQIAAALARILSGSSK